MHIVASTAACPAELLEALQQARSHTDVLQPCRQLSWDSGRSVTLSRCNASGRMVVVKTHSRADSAQLQQVLSEAHIHSRLTHSPHISQLLVAAQDSRQVVIVMEYAEGGTLRDSMCGLSEERLRDWVTRPLLQALATLEAQGIVHRDVKPENVLIHNDQLLLTDFGLALCVAPAGTGDSCFDGSSCDEDSGCSVSRCSSASGSVQASRRCSVEISRDSSLTACGTPMYTAPEVLLAMFKSQPLRNVVTPKNDVWSLGLMLLEALTGNHPFSEDACAAAGGNVLYSIAHHKTVALPESMGSEFREFLTQVLQRDPERRPTAQQLLRHPWLSTNSSTSTEADAVSLLDCTPHMRARSASDSGLPDAADLIEALNGVVPRSLSNGAIVGADESSVDVILALEARGLQHALSDPNVLGIDAEVMVKRAAVAAAAAAATAAVPIEVHSDVPQGQTAFEMAMSWED